MTIPIYIGDEVSAMGFRLAGYRVRVTDTARALQDLEWACHESSLVMISASTARELPAPELDQYLSKLTPSVVVVPDVHGMTPIPDLASRLRSLLGVEE
jgi:vacuolar-type H+-ATPase subunit F/Vma7